MRKPVAGADTEGAHPARALLKLEKIWFFGVKSWFFIRNTPKIFAPPSARRNFFKCVPPNLKSWIRPCYMLTKYWIIVSKYTNRLFVGGHVSYLRYLCLFAYSGVQYILCCVFVLFVFVLCSLCCQVLWIVNFFILSLGIF